MTVAPTTIAVLGCGNRAAFLLNNVVSRFSHLARVVAVAEPRAEAREHVAGQWDVGPGQRFESWQDFVAQPRMCDAVLIATMDRDHAPAAVACLALGYDVLLEKPMGITADECRAVVEAQQQSGSILGVCHSLRYHKAFTRLKELVDAGAVGRLITIDHIEQVEVFHFAHSYVRGNWSREDTSSFMLLTKSCHDLDYIAYLVGAPCLSVSSFGSLTYFRPEHAPPGSTERCTDPCPVEPECAFSAVKQYGSGLGALSSVAGLAATTSSWSSPLDVSPYGRCVWKCDNDVVDHQVVSMEFAEEVTATFTMTAFTQQGGRRLRVHGTLGEIEFTEKAITVRTFAGGDVQRIELHPETGGHGGGDTRLFRDWLMALRDRTPERVVSGAGDSLAGHLIAFAAEESRRTGKTVTVTLQ